MLKATKVDGVYDADPLTHPDAERHERLTYGEVLNGPPAGARRDGRLAVHGERPARSSSST